MNTLTSALLTVARSLPADATMTVPASWVLSLANAPTETAPVATSPARPLLTVAQAAERIAHKPAWLYQHRSILPFMVRLGTRGLRVDPVKLEKWIASRGAR